MKQGDVYKLFSEWFDSVNFEPMSADDKDKLWHGFSVGYQHDNNTNILSALQQLVECYDSQDGKQWTTSSKRRALDAAHAAIDKALGE